MRYQKRLKLLAGLAGVMLAATSALLVALFGEGQTGGLISGIGPSKKSAFGAVRVSSKLIEIRKNGSS